MLDRREFTKLVGGVAGAGFVAAPAAGADPLSEIEILTDEFNESHVYADDLYSLGYGNGYVQAGDRLFLMDVIRHIGRGDSAKVLGPAQIPSDIQVRRDLYGPDAIQRQWESASETIRESIRGYADGVNRRMVEMAAQGNLPGEFAALGHAPEPWEPTDTVAAINYLIGYFGVSGGDELSNARTYRELVENLGDEEAAWTAYGDLNWLRTTDDHFTSIPADDKVVEGGEEVRAFDEVSAAQRRAIEVAADVEPWGIATDVDVPESVTEGRRAGVGLMEGFKWGSNAFVVDGDLSETGEPLLGGGPQMGYFKPPIPYEIGLHGAGFDMTGIGVVGAPALVIGRTAPGEDRDALAWTVTSGRDDMVDTVAVDLDPTDKHRYRWNGEWHTMQTETVTHVASPLPPALAGEADARVVEQEVARIEQAGTSMPVVAWNPDENVAFCQRVTTRFEELTGAFMWAECARANDLDDFERRIEEFPFTFNFHVVSESGDVGYYHTGKIPERVDGPDYRFPVPDAEHGWLGTTAGLGLGTHVRNPSRGYVVNWNNGPAKGWRAGDMEQNWGSVHRVEELDGFIREALGVPAGVRDGAPVKNAARETLSVEDVKTIVSKAALHDATAAETGPPLARAASESSDDRVAEMGSLLSAWIDADAPWNDEPEPADGSYEPPTHGDDVYEHAGHAIFDEVRRALQESIFGDELGERNADLSWEPAVSRHAAPHGTAWDDVTFNDALAGDTDHDWLDGSRDALVREAFVAAADALESEFGTPEPSEWLAAVHRSVFLSVGGTKPTSMDMRNRASYNQAVSIGLAQSDDPAVWQANAGDVLPPANSGHLSGPELARSAGGGADPERVTDQQELYVTNEYKPHPVTRAQVEAVATGAKTIRPTTAALDGPLTVSDDVPVDPVLHLFEGADAGEEEL